MSTALPSPDPSIFAANPQGSATYKAIGVSLAVASGLFIGTSFVLKKKGLIESTDRSGNGYSYLGSFMWWTGMTLMIIGEVCNFVAYAFTQAILVTPLGALSVVVSAILSSIFLKERLSFHGKIGCFQCIIGAVVIVLQAPEQSSQDTSINTFKGLVLSVGFLVYTGIFIIITIVLIIYVVPRWGTTNMLVYISICSLIGAISVVFTQGLGMAIVHSITIENQFTNYFIYIVILIVIATLIIEIVYLNKALNIFNTAVVTPTYYVMFTTLTIVSSIVLYRSFDATPTAIATCVMGFFSICTGVALLHRNQKLSSEDFLDGKLEAERDDDDDDDGQVGPAQIFPFAGITRYASKRTHQRRRNSCQTPVKAATHMGVHHHFGNNNSCGGISVVQSKTIAVGNTADGEDGYRREVRWKEKFGSVEAREKEEASLQKKKKRQMEQQEAEKRYQAVLVAAQQVAITIQEPLATQPKQDSATSSLSTPSSPPQPLSSGRRHQPPARGKMIRGLRSTPPRRAQDHINWFTAHQIGIGSNRKDEDRASLVSSSTDRLL
ncbi:magnesium transporter NIPA-domain-containing protein [Dichotomocladium elegans]|nr:magnesium transporter NIPA-domain-containing protein [Dichotomocladium elegans]